MPSLKTAVDSFCRRRTLGSGMMAKDPRLCLGLIFHRASLQKFLPNELLQHFNLARPFLPQYSFKRPIIITVQVCWLVGRQLLVMPIYALRQWLRFSDLLYAPRQWLKLLALYWPASTYLGFLYFQSLFSKNLYWSSLDFCITPLECFTVEYLDFFLLNPRSCPTFSPILRPF